VDERGEQIRPAAEQPNPNALGGEWNNFWLKGPGGAIVRIRIQWNKRGGVKKPQWAEEK
jgi:hypothetical protein